VSENTNLLQNVKLCWQQYRASIDRPISRESSSSPNLERDRAAHPVCDH